MKCSSSNSWRAKQFLIYAPGSLLSRGSAPTSVTESCPHSSSLLRTPCASIRGGRMLGYPKGAWRDSRGRGTPHWPPCRPRAQGRQSLSDPNDVIFMHAHGIMPKGKETKELCGCLASSAVDLSVPGYQISAVDATALLYSTTASLV